MKSVPRPSTAGRQRPTSASLVRGGSQLLTPRGMSSGGLPAAVEAPYGVVEGEAEASHHVAACAGAERMRRIETRESGCQTLLAEDADVRRSAHMRHEQREGQDASNRALDAMAAALQTRQAQSKALAEACRSRDKLQDRVRALEAEVASLTHRLNHKCRMEDAAKHPTRTVTVVDVTGFLSSMGNGVPSAGADGACVVPITQAPRDEPHARHFAPSASTGASHGGGLGTLDRLKRDWRDAQQRAQQQTGDMSRHYPSYEDDGNLRAVGEPRLQSTMQQGEKGGASPTHQRCSTSDHNASSSEFTSLRAANDAMAAQQAIIASLENENSVLRRQRDEQLDTNHKEHQRLLQELEETRETLDEKDAHWHAKQKELNRLRTLMRFSQLKRDSDKLQETFVRIDELENRLRQLHAQHHRDALDRDDLRRLRIIEMQVTKALKGELPWSAFPRELLGLAPATTTAATTSAAKATAMPVRPSTAKAASYGSSCRSRSGGGGSTADDNGPSSTLTPQDITASSTTAQPLAVRQGSMPRDEDNAASSFITTDTTVVDTPTDTPTKPPRPAAGTSSWMHGTSDTAEQPSQHVAGAHPVGGSAGSMDNTSTAATATPLRDEDVSFSTITERMQAYLQRRARQQQDAARNQHHHQQAPSASGGSAPLHRQLQSAHGRNDPDRAHHLPAAYQRGLGTSSSMGDSASNFAKRIDLLRLQHHDLVGGGSRGAARPQSASRSGAPGLFGFQRPSSASTRRPTV